MIMMIMTNSYWVKILLFILLSERFPFCSLTKTMLEPFPFGDCNSSATFPVDGEYPSLVLLHLFSSVFLQKPEYVSISGHWTSSFTFLPCLCHLLSTPSFFNWSLQKLAVFYSTPNLLLVTSIICMTHITLRPFGSLIFTSHNLMSNIPLTTASYSTVISLIIHSNNCIISKILILSILTFDHYLLPFQLMYSSNTLISVIPSMY